MRRSLLSLSLVVFLSSARAFATGVEPDKATAIQRTQAQQRFDKGKALLAKKKYDEALVEFRASMEIVESPNTRLAIAHTLREMGKLVDAYAELERTEVEAKELAAQDPRYNKAVKAAQDERADVKKQLGFVTVTVDNAHDDTKLTIGGEEILRGGWGEAAPVVPGAVDVTVETPGHQPVTKTVNVSAGGSESITIDANEGASTETTPKQDAQKPASSSEETSSTRKWAYVAGGVGAVGLATFAVAGLWSNSVYSGLKSDCGSGPCPPSNNHDSQVSKGKALQTIANAGLVVGVIGAGLGVTLFVMSSPSSKSTTEVTVGPTGFSVRGAF